MKKLSVAILLIALTLALAACGGSASPFVSSRWLENASDTGVAAVNEFNRYTVSFTASEPKDGEDASEKPQIAITPDSYYTTKLTDSEYEGKACYLYETEQVMRGSIAIGETSEVLDDRITARCYFSGVKNGLRALYSERSVSAHSIIKKDGKYSVVKCVYTVKTVYNGSSAEVEFKKGEGNQAEFSIKEGTVKYTKISGYYIDNEILLFAPRSTKLSSSFAFTTIDPLARAKRDMALTPNELTPTATLKPEGYYSNGSRVSEILCYVVNVSINSAHSGSDLVAFYADPAKDKRATLIQLQTMAAYDLGVYTYNIIQSAY